jgi:hypothetical protein
MVNPGGRATVADLDVFDRDHAPRVSARAAFDLLAQAVRRPHEPDADVLGYVASRAHSLGACRGGTSGYDDEARAFAAAHFRQTGVTPEQMLVFCSGAKGAFLAFCAALMCRRRHDDLHHLGGLLLTPAGYYPKPAAHPTRLRRRHPRHRPPRRPGHPGLAGRHQAPAAPLPLRTAGQQRRWEGPHP